ncbi:MAG: nucleotidyltransferase domain-containing protein [Candidatus Falkowbacteria bacterium]|nr:nucleotidyltransferase domain-containing protein [Candidatus Falkowbacteria bacterium]
MEQKDYKMKIIGELLKGENHVRGISKSLRTNHMNISRRIKELSKENVVDFKIEGKNKTYFLKNTHEARTYLLIYESYKLLRILEKYPILRSIIERIQSHPKIKIAILFGSYAKGLAKQDSDIDIYIETEDKKLKDELGQTHSKLSIKIGKFDKDNLLIKEIIKNHVILKGAEEYYDKAKLFS